MFREAGTTAILIFSRTAAAEAAVKTFDKPSGKKGNALIARYFIKKTVHTARQTGLPVFLHYDADHHESTFGERLADAIEAVFQKGYSRVITIGNDIPDLTTDILLTAGQELVHHPMVLGPAADGGVYLIGFRRENYRRAAFIALPWQTGALQTAWKNSSEINYPEAVWLVQLNDIDLPADFRLFLKKLQPWSPLLRLLSSIRRLFVGCTLVHFTSRKMDAAMLLRGPPAL